MTVKMVPGVGHLRRMKVAAVLRTAFVGAARGDGFGICQFSVQRNHIHLVCEADSAERLGCGMHRWMIRVARGLNRLLGRTGKVFADRYHSVLVTAPRQMRNALCYVMQNARRHGEKIDPNFGGIDPFTSAWYFDGWSEDTWRANLVPATGPPPVAETCTWLLQVGWKRHRLIGIGEYPAVALEHAR